jgi:NitT/TauT family transport system substrate-binding protein
MLMIRKTGAAALLGALALVGSLVLRHADAADLDYGKPGDPVQLVVGYQPYYSEAWSGAVIDGLQLWKKHLPPGSTVEFRVGLQGSIIVNAMLAGKESIGYLGDMPAIVGATKRQVADLRIVASIGLSHDQCNVIFVRNDAPQFATPIKAIAWLQGKQVAAPKGSCTDRFARAVFEKAHVTPADYLNQSIEVITSGFRAGKLDAAIVWEPTASRLVLQGLARRVATGNDVGEDDGAFIDMRADLIKQRPDIVKAWLETELEAEHFLADPKNASTVAALVQAQTTGFDKKQLWQALFGTYPTSAGGAPIRLIVPFGFTSDSLALIQKATAFLYSINSIDVPKLADDAVLPDLTATILKEQGETAPVGTIKAAPSNAFE